MTRTEERRRCQKDREGGDEMDTQRDKEQSLYGWMTMASYSTEPQFPYLFNVSIPTLGQLNE